MNRYISKLKNDVIKMAQNFIDHPSLSRRKLLSTTEKHKLCPLTIINLSVLYFDKQSEYRVKLNINDK